MQVTSQASWVGLRRCCTRYTTSATRRRARPVRPDRRRPDRQAPVCGGAPGRGSNRRFGVHRLLWRQIWSNNPNERLNREIRRRTDVVGIFADGNSIIRLVGTVLAEQPDEWAEGRSCLGLDILAKSRRQVSSLA
jgi:hypothetical protein